MEWVLYFAFYWWLVVATVIVTVVYRTANKKPESRPAVVKSPSKFQRMKIKGF